MLYISTRGDAAAEVPETAPPYAERREAERLRALQRYAILDTTPEASFDRITRLAARLLDAPVAVVSLVDRDRQWLKSRHGQAALGAESQGWLYADTIRGDDVHVVPDTTLDPRFAAGPGGTGPPPFRFYAGAPLATADGHNVGALAVMDQRPRIIAAEQRRLLAELAAMVVEVLELRSLGLKLRTEIAERERTEWALRESEQRVRDFAETASDWFWETDEQLRFSFFSDRYVDQTGESVTARLGKRRDQVALRDPSDDDWDAHLDDVANRRPYRDFAYAYLDRDGVRRFAETSGKPIFDVAGRFRGYRGSARDITERRRAERALRESEERYRKLVETSPDGIIITQRGLVTFANARALAMLGANDRRSVLGRPALRFTDSRTRATIKRMARGLAEGRSIEARETVLRRLDGTKVDVEAVATPISIGGADAVQLVLHDISARKRAEAERARLAAVLEATPDMVAVCTPELETVYINRAGREMLGIEPGADIVGRHPSRSHPPAMWNLIESEALPAATENGSWQGESAVLGADGREIPVSQVVLAHRDDRGALAFFSTIVRDITERKRSEERIRHLAHHDALTGLPNRRLFQDRLEQALALARRDGRPISVMMLDLDYFKEANDTLGHDIGDQLLCAVARRIRDAVRASDTVARIGGDEFAVIQSGLAQTDGAAALAQKMIEALARPFDLGHHEVRLAASIGIALFPQDGDDHDRLLRTADLALYGAKREGRNCWRFFDESMHRKVLLRKTLERDLRQALARDELRVVYQPQLDPRTNRIVSAEALVRWRHPDRGLIPPGEFIPVAETSGLIRTLGRWILDEACQEARAWADSGHPLRVAVNLSPAEMRGDELLATVDEILRRHRLPPGLLELEITERLFMEPADSAVGACVRGLAGRGIRLAIDDFGTGYSSLAYLKRLPVSKIKIDKSFVRDIGQDTENEAVVLAVIALAKSLGKAVIAEGVETPSQLSFLRRHGCDEVQGFLISHPTSARQFRRLLNGGAPSPHALDSI